jgi:hypothetical protein
MSESVIISGRQARKLGTIKPCRFDGCERPAKTHGWCNGHYLQVWSGKPLKPLKVRRRRAPASCSFPGCARLHDSGGYCHAHYQQAYRGRKLGPLGWSEASPVEVKGEIAEVVLRNRKGQETGRAVVDAGDVALVSGRRWFKAKSGGYAVSKDRDANGREVNVWMHRVILGTAPGLETDHKDGNRLNNRRGNLRPATDGENCQNAVRPGREELRGVCFERRSKTRPWLARAILDGRTYYGGSYATREEAIVAARALRARLFTHHNEDRHQSPEAAAS